MNISIITVGNKPSPELAEFINSYTQRLPRNITLNWIYLKHANFVNTNTSKQYESENILKHITKTDFVILLDETGGQISSTQLSEKIFATNKNIIFVIGGAYGVDDSVFARANFVWSLSKLVFPHQIVRLLLSEQLYRAYTISVNHPYHHS
jgi:23S rRNA (pseudouridine1915-N3)-methyltransferase